jgi:hypothetical protein
MQQHDIGQSGRIQDLGYRGANTIVKPVHSGVNERGVLIIDQELVEGNAVPVEPGGNP